VGKNLALRLKGMGVTTALEFKQADPAAVRKSMGVIGERMLRELNGIPCLELEEMPPDKKGVMASRSFGSLVESLEELEEALANHVARAAEKIRRCGLLATRLEVFLRTNRFRKEDPQYCPGIGITLDRPTNGTGELMTTARELLHRIYRPGYRYKKTGIQLAQLVSEEEYQPELFDRPKARIDVDRIVDEINSRMGDPKNPVITRLAMGTDASLKRWKMRSNSHSPHYTTNWQQLPTAKI